MSRTLLSPLGTAAALAASIALSAIPASAHPHRHHRQCVLTEHGARIDVRPCYDYRCWRRVPHGRAFRVLRWDGDHVLVRNWQMKGWVRYYEVYPVHKAYCRAAGI